MKRKSSNQTYLDGMKHGSPAEKLKEIQPLMDEIATLARELDRWQTEVAEEKNIEIKEKIDGIKSRVGEKLEEYENHPVYGDMSNAPFYRDTIELFDWNVDIAESLENQRSEVDSLLDMMAEFFNKWQEQIKSVAVELENRDLYIKTLKKELEFYRGGVN